MNLALHYISFCATVLLLPPMLIAIIRKTKARFQNRKGARFMQPYYDLNKFLSKGETISKVASWVFRSTSVINLVTMTVLAVITPWLSYSPHLPDASDIFLIVYLFALARFFTVLAALDAGSVFGGFGASREVTVALLAEPGVILCLASLGCVAHTSDLTQVFSYSIAQSELLYNQPALWLLAGSGLFLSAIVELSRMPIDDPNTHLELTMIHEAMILENSGRNLALTEFAHYLKMAILLGLSGQCLLHAIPRMWVASGLVKGLASIGVIVFLALTIAVMESVLIKLQWKKLPEFIAYSVAMSLLCMLIAVGIR